MPSLPTSLILLGLVAAWLVVLVPMVAKRREEVPENDEDSAGFRVLRRESATGRRRPVFSRTAAGIDATNELDDVSELDDASDADVRLDGDQDVAEERDRRGDAAPDDAIDDQPADDNARDDVVAAPADVVELRAAPTEAVGDDMTNTSSRGQRHIYDESRGDDTADHRYSRVDGSDEFRSERVGRGGYDPRAAAASQERRFRRRRRVVSALLGLTVVSAAVGLFGVGSAWAVTVTGVVLLVLYLANLRRQVRLEADIRARRAARMRRAEQIRPVFRASVAEQVRAYRSGEEPRPGYDAEPYRVNSHARPTVPSTYRTRGVPVDMDDSDPDFDELEYYDPMPYRRAVGQ